MLERDAIHYLDQWQVSPYRKPLILRGARQVGKSHLVRAFAKRFKYFIEINLEEAPNTHAFFEHDLALGPLLEKMSLYGNAPIIDGETLIFLDEIQACERAIIALRYFKEKRPDLHIIAAGSLIDFALHHVGVPVGRVEFLHVYPLSFGEYLQAIGRTDLRAQILKCAMPDVIHEMLLEHLHRYIWLGGMPEVINVWKETQDVRLCQRIQNQIIQTYQRDFSKYAKISEMPNVDKVFNNIPKQLGDKFICAHVDHEVRSKEIKQAIFLLEKAGIAYVLYHNSAQAHPLGAGVNLKHFKVFFFDIGIANRLLKLNLTEWATAKINVKHLGGIAEQLVLQEHYAYQYYDTSPEAYYWQRETRGSQAEVDFIFSLESDIVPIEVKAGKGGSLKSLHAYLASHPHTPRSYKISEQNFYVDSLFSNLPLYALEVLSKPEVKA